MLFQTYLDRKYNMTAQTAPIVLGKLKKYIESTTTKFIEIKDILISFLSNLNEIKIQGKTAVADSYNKALKPRVRVFLVNLSTSYDSCINNNEDSEKCRKMLVEIERIVNNLARILYDKESNKVGGGGNQSSCFGSSCISTDEEEKDGRENEVYSGPVFGQYITVENGIFVTKLIKSEEELERLEKYFGYTKEEDIASEEEDIASEEQHIASEEQHIASEEEYIPNVDSFDTDVDNTKAQTNDVATNDDDEEVRKITNDNDDAITIPPNLFKTPIGWYKGDETKEEPDLNNDKFVPISENAGGKKTKKTKKHKKPKNKKYTKKNVKRQQARHNKTTKRKRPTKRRAKRTRRQRNHTNH
jgi:hypothetical protein